MVAKDSLRPLSRRAAWNSRVRAQILVFGAEGQAGREIAALAKARGIEVLGCTRRQADITSPLEVEAAICSANPGLVLNAAAYTAVDRAEAEPEAARKANTAGAGIVARAAAARRLPVIHISTDYVFDGTKKGAYIETDPVSPLGVYGLTKAAGEMRVREENPRHIILRTSWVYGRFGTNFLKTVLRLSREREELRIVADQWGCPTASQDLAEAAFAIGRACALGAEAWGTYHFAGTGVTSWHGFASFIIEAQAQAGGPRPRLIAIPSTEYPSLAKRPANSALNCELFAGAFGYKAPPWQARALETIEMLLKGSRAQP